MKGLSDNKPAANKTCSENDEVPARGMSLISFMEETSKSPLHDQTAQVNNTTDNAPNISHATAEEVLKSVSSPNGDTSGTNPFLHLASSELDQSIESITTDEVCIKEIGSDDSLNVTES